jgi:predicted ATPase
MPRYVITGGLGTGKTSVMSALGDGVTIMPEPARQLIAEHRGLTGEFTLDDRPDLFVERLTARSVKNYRSVADPTVAVFDRGIPDCVAYASVYGIDTRPALEAAVAYSYENPVFVAPPWEEIYTTDDMRKATFAEAEAFHAEVISTYDRLGYELVEIPKMPVAERASFVLTHIG